MQKKIIYIGNFSFPYGNASGARVIGNGYLLRDMGFEVSFIGLNKHINPNEQLQNTKLVFDNFTYYNFKPSSGIHGWLNYNKIYLELEKHLEIEKPDIIILYGSLTLSLINEKIRKWCNKNKIKIYADCVDMIPVKTGGLAYKLVKSFDEYFQKRIVNSRTDGVISISSYISKFYKERDCRTVIIPPLVNSDRFSESSNVSFDNDVINLVYVGNPFPTDGRKVLKSAFKDRLDLILEMLGRLDDYNYLFRIYGLTKADYLAVIPEHQTLLAKMQGKIRFEGHVENDEAVKSIRASDFSILLRDINVMTTAGFPTKFVESIACGTPVIANDSSDLKFYLKDGQNGFLMGSLEPDEIDSRLKYILSLGREAIDKMKIFTRENNYFLYSEYKADFSKFLHDE